MFLLIRSELIDMTATELSSTSLKRTHCVQKFSYRPLTIVYFLLVNFVSNLSSLESNEE